MAKRRTRLWLLPVMLAAAGFCYLDNCTVQTTFRTLRCATLPEAFSGLRIVQISDLHGRVFGKEHAALLSAVRAAKPDFIAITGDLADEDTALPSLRPLLAGLTALAPVYYVTGNHEWVISRAVRQTLCDLLDSYGVIRLENDYRVLERDGQRLVIAGVDDPNGPADQKTAPELVREIRSAYGEDVFILALCHRNDQLPGAVCRRTESVCRTRSGSSRRTFRSCIRSSRSWWMQMGSAGSSVMFSARRTSC